MSFHSPAARSRLSTARIGVYVDEDGHEFLEQEFSDGSSILMTRPQWDAICLSAATNAKTILDLND